MSLRPIRTLLPRLLQRIRRLFTKSDFQLPAPARIELHDLEKAFARLFATEDGKKVLGHLSGITFMRAAGMEAPDHVLRHMEGQRSLLAVIIRMIDRGRN